MIHPRAPHFALLVAAALALSGCGGAQPEPAATEVGIGPLSTQEGAAPAPTTSSHLVGVVGAPEDPDAYEIALTDQSGTAVTTLPAGDYTLTFADLSTIHNFRLTGPGDIDVGTEVDEVDETTLDVTLVPGTYTFVCDPHSGTMRGEVEVTG